ncbi:hypothetical protein ACF071_29605 [Streptomyces albidoflavus]
MTDLYADGAAEANRTRAHWALTALEAFGKETGQNYIDGTLDVGDDVLRELGGDLLADLFHLARLNGCAPEIVIDAGLMHFEAELDEERAEEIEPHLERAKSAGVELSPGDFNWDEDRPTIDGMEPADWLDHMTD